MKVQIIKSVFLVGILSIALPVAGQILDDSTRLIYGTHTTKYVLEEDIYNDVPQQRMLDTSFHSLYNYHLLHQGPFVYQNLGNFGTPLGNIYLNPLRNLGRSFGFHSFDPYAFNPDRVFYFDTRSPYSVITYRQSATGIQFGDALYARNIKPNWNAGFQLRRFTANKTIGVVTRSDRQSEHTSFLFFNRFFTKDSVYQVLANFSVMDHRNFETGGVVMDSIETLGDLFDYQAEDIRFFSARSLERRLGFHLYHELKPTGPFQIFHEFDYKNQSDRFRNVDTDSGYFPGLPDSILANDGAAIDDRTDFKLLENRAGIKGYWKKLYYHLYYKRRDYSYGQDCESCQTTKYDENFAGGDIRFYVLDSAFVKVAAEYLLGKDYFLSGMIRSKWLSGGYSRTNHSPSLLQLRYEGSRLNWNNEDQFENVSIDHLWAKADVDLKRFYIQPSFDYAILTNYIYFGSSDTVSKPVQEASSIQYVSAGLFFKLNVSKFWLENHTRYADASRVINVPRLFNHTRLYFQSWLFKKALFMQLGFDLYYRDSYFANAYMPITQQYYLNESFVNDNYFFADVFLNLKIKTVSGFVKFSNINGADYFITPWYPGYPRTFEFGVRWMFFD